MKLKPFLNQFRESKILPGTSILETLFFFAADNILRIKSILVSQVVILRFLITHRYLKKTIFLDEIRFNKQSIYDYIVYTFGDRGFARGTTFSRIESLGKCLGEVFERVPFKKGPTTNTGVLGSRRSLLSQGMSVFDLNTLPKTTDEQRKNNTKTHYDDDSVMEWCELISFSTQKPILVPKQLVYWDYAPERPEPILKEQNTSGLASAESETAAMLAALSECLQRHVFFSAWFHPQQNLVREIPLHSLTVHPDLLESAHEAAANMLNLRIFKIDSELREVFDVYFCVLENTLTGGFYLGCSGGNDSYSVIKRAIQEAFSIYVFTNRILFYGEELNTYKTVATTNFQYGIYGNHRVIWWGHHVDEDGRKAMQAFLGTQTESYVYTKSTEEDLLKKVTGVFGDFFYTFATHELTKKFGHSACRVILPHSYTLHLNEHLATPVLHGVCPQNHKMHPFP